MIDQGQFSAQEKWELFRALTIKGGLYTPPSAFNPLPGTYSLDAIREKRSILPLATELSREDAAYVHIPFCKGGRCSFCMYPSIVRYSDEDISIYIKRIVKELSYWRDLMSVSLRSFYVGGGTPTVLSSKQLHEIFDPLLSLPFFENAERTCEVSPTTVDTEKIKTIHDIGFNRLSIGVQSFDPIVLKSVGREYVSRECIKKLVGTAREYGFADVNVDMLIGLPNEQFENICTDIKSVLRSGALSLTVYACRNLRIKSDIEEQERRSRMEHTLSLIYDIIEKEQWTREEGGVGTEYNCFGSPEKCIRLVPHITYGDGFRNYNLWGLGAKSISVTPAMAYRCDSYDLGFSASDKRYKVFEYTPKQQMQLALCTMLYSRNMTIDCKLFEEAFGMHVIDAFCKEFKELEQLNRVEHEGNHRYIRLRCDNTTDEATAIKFFWDWNHLLSLAGA